MPKVTRKDVAREAHVTETIVSYTLNGNRYVDKEKKERVLAAAKKLGYRPSMEAMALRGKATKHIIFITDDVSNEYFATIVSEMEKSLKSEGYLISLTCDRGNPDFVRLIEQWRFDGIMIGSSSVTEAQIQTLIDTGMPTVLLGMNDYPAFSGSYGLIYTGLKEGVKNAISVMRSQGRKRIAFIDSLSPSGSPVEASGFRYKGYIESLDGQDPIVVDSCRTYDELAEAVGSAWREKGFDGAICRTDVIGAETIAALKSQGARIPQDVAVVGVNNDRLTKYTDPPLSSIAIRKDLVASSAIKLFELLRDKEGMDGPNSIQLETRLIMRASI